MSKRKQRRRRRRKTSENHLNDLDLKIAREAIKRSGKRTTHYIA